MLSVPSHACDVKSVLKNVYKTWSMSAPVDY